MSLANAAIGAVSPARSIPAAPPSVHEVAAWALMAGALLLTFELHLLPALLAGLLVPQLVRTLAPFLAVGRLSHARSRLLVVSLITLVVLSSLVGTVVASVLYLRTEGGLVGLLAKMAEILDNSRQLLPAWAAAWLPQGDETVIRAALVDWLRAHAQEIQQVGGSAGHGLLHVVVGLVIGSFVALRKVRPSAELAPLARALQERVERLSEAFRRVVFAQVRISALNTTLTAVYLMGALPAFGVHLPFAKTMIVVTFLVGLVPVLGNLVSNAIIVVISLSQSLHVAIASLIFLIVVHKLEYFVNARIVGGQIKAGVWEMLVVLVVMEAAFGVPGVIAGPILYAYVKKELSDRRLV